MPTDPLEALANRPVPPLPGDFSSQLHHRVNHWLLTTHLVEFALQAAASAARDFGPAIGGWLELTMTGRLRGAPPRPPE